MKYTLSSENSKIQQNSEKDFIIKKSNWEYSIDILFNHKENINLVNLYGIVKSYLYDESYLINFFLVISIEKLDDKNMNKFHYLEINKLKKMNFLNFEDFFLKLYDNDFNYIKTSEYYGFRVVFFKESYFWKNKLIYPLFPWEKSPLKNELNSFNINEKEIQNYIQKLELENEYLKEIIKNEKKK
jgi:hypothetical protein